MKLSENGKKFLIKEEGVVLHPYKDDAGYPTIGVGSRFYENGVEVKMTDKPISLERAMSIMTYTLKQYEEAVTKAIGGAKVNQNQFDAMVSLCYNIGTYGFASSSVARKVKADPNNPSIGESFLAWRNATIKGKKEPVLLGRRKREYALYTKPVTAQASTVKSKFTTTDVNLRSGAGTQFKIITALPKGTEVNVLSEANGWSSVFICSNKLTGFVSSQYLK